MDTNFVGYLLNALEPDEQQQVEQHLKQDPAARQHLDLLRRALEPLAADKEHAEPEAGLVFRTIARVAEYRCRPQPQAPALSPPMQAERRWYRRSDILIAASVLLLVGGIGVPGLVKIRSGYQKTACEENLVRFYRGFDTYCSTHGEELPTVGDSSNPRQNRAGIFVPKLIEAQALPPDASIHCPGNGTSCAEARYTLADLDKMSVAEFELAAKGLCGCYAYTLGYTDPEGQWRMPRRGERGLNDTWVPIMSDKPSPERGNSPNHRGQNVLYMNGTVRFCTTPNVGVDGNHIFENDLGQVAAGLNWKDAVLGCSEDKP